MLWRKKNKWVALLLACLALTPLQLALFVSGAPKRRSRKLSLPANRKKKLASVPGWSWTNKSTPTNLWVVQRDDQVGYNKAYKTLIRDRKAAATLSDTTKRFNSIDESNPDDNIYAKASKSAYFSRLNRLPWMPRNTSRQWHSTTRRETPRIDLNRNLHRSIM